MATLNIKDPEVHRMARLLADQRGTSATAAVRQALAEALARHEAHRAGVGARLLRLSERSRKVPEPIRSDDDLYDEAGLPR